MDFEETRDNAQELIFVMENGTEAHFPWIHIPVFQMSNITKCIERDGDALIEYERFDELHAVINSASNDQHLQFGIFPSGASVFDQFIAEGEIAQVIISGHSGEEIFYIDDDREINVYRDNGDLVIDIA